MQIDEGLDTGAVLMRAALPIAPKDTSSTLHDKLAVLGGELVVQTLAQLSALTAMPQPAEGVSYAAKILKDEALIDWHLPAHLLSQRIRAFDPFPGAHTLLQGQTLKIWSAQALHDKTSATPGTVLQADAQALCVATADGVLQLLQLQLPGGKRIIAAEFVHGHPGLVGQVLGR
jgi:methionyl-tRNA formyltransferase